MLYICKSNNFALFWESDFVQDHLLNEFPVIFSRLDTKESQGRSVHFEDETDGKQDAASLSSSAGSLASSAGSLSSSASASSGSSAGSSSSSGSGGSDGPGSSNNNNSNNNNAGVDVRSGVKDSSRGRIVQQGMATDSGGGSSEHAIIRKSDNGEKKGKADAADESRSQMVSQDNQVEDESIQRIQSGKPQLAPIANTETVAPVKKQGRKAGSKKKKPKKEKDDRTRVDETQHPVPGEYRPYPPMDSHLQRVPEEVAWNHHPEDWRTRNSITHQPQEQPESDEESEGGSESGNESGSGSGSGSDSSSEEEDSDGDDDDDDGNEGGAPGAQNMNGYDKTQSNQPASRERQGESSKDEAESEDEDGSGDDSGSDDDEESGSDTGSESESGSGSEDESESEED